jgi:hypothetical protein
MMRSFVPLVAGCIALIAAAPAAAQQTVIVGGTVISASTGQSLSFSTVSIVGGAQRFTSSGGSFSFALPPGQYSFRIRQLGYAPLDTTIAVNPGANLRSLTFALKPAAYRLDVVRTFANSCPRGDAEGMGGLFDELIKNADRERILRNEYPFVYDLERWVNLRVRGVTQGQAFDTVRFASAATGHYSPGHIVHALDPRAQKGAREMSLPTLIDLADPVFIASHCFRYRGIERVADTAAYRIDFKPTDDVDAPDVEGSIFLDSASYSIRKAIFRLTKPGRLDPPSLGLEVTTTYHEIHTGLSLFDNIHSVQPLSRNYRFPAEGVQDLKLITVRFYGATPGDIVLSDSSAIKARSRVIDSSATLSGFVVDSGGRALRGAQIILTDGSSRAASGDSGQFILKGLKPGKAEVLVRVLGFAPATFSTVLRAARNRRVRVILSPVSVQLTTIVVRDSISDPLLAKTGFFDRRKSGMGSFISPEQIEKKNPQRASDMLRALPGVKIDILPDGSGKTLPFSMRSWPRRCLMAVFIDGVKTEIGGRGGMMTTLEDVIAGYELGAIEVYPGPAETPPQFIGGENACGTIVIWTKGWLSAETEADTTKHE